MIKQIFVILSGLLIGLYIGFIGVNNIWNYKPNKALVFNPIAENKSQVIGFLPYWLIPKADKDYTKYINTLSYFGLTIDSDGSILEYTNPGESEPGWLALNSGKADAFLEMAKKNNVKKSLLIFSADEEKIGGLLENPVTHAQNLMAEVGPIMKNYGFTDLNLDIESTLVASDEARANFTTFVKAVKQQLDKENLGTLTIDVSPIVLFKKYLVDVNSIRNDVDYVVLMTYDFHYQGSSVTGAVAPNGGAGDSEEFDIEVSLKAAQQILSPDKIIMGAPLYGYEWETLDNTPRSATIAGSGIVAGNRRVEEQLKSCTDCQVAYDEKTKESILIYKDENSDSYHQIYYPVQKSIEEKIKLADKYDLGGIALWALGYEGDTILEPLKSYK